MPDSSLVLVNKDIKFFSSFALNSFMDSRVNLSHMFDFFFSSFRRNCLSLTLDDRLPPCRKNRGAHKNGACIIYAVGHKSMVMVRAGWQEAFMWKIRLPRRLGVASQ